MGIRETLNENQTITMGAAGGVILIALIFIVWYLWPSGGGSYSSEAYYTTDNGATYFADDARKMPPFAAKDGKEAVRAYVFRCGKGKPFVGYLERLSPEGQKMLEQAKKAPPQGPPGAPPQDPTMMMPMMMQYQEIKRPTDKEWSNMANMEAAGKVTSITCPDGTTNDIKPVMP